MMEDHILKEFIKNALAEDRGDGDHTSLASIDSDAAGGARLIIKESGVLAGIRVAAEVFHQVDKNLKTELFLADGDRIVPGNIAFHITGRQQSLLLAERLVLNILQRMSGIATATAAYVEAVRGFNTRITDTRKTTPGMRFLEKEAVRLGGGINHRMGLYDMIMLKDNHIDFAGGISAAIGRTQSYLKRTGRSLNIEVEARTLRDVEEIMSVGGINRIMFDNFSVSDTERAVKIVNGRYETESSGGITLETLRAYAACGVDFISVGALTHHISSLDMSMKAL
jgi:nicotinate-nucleotide pyrophosphorylase (carboxylating)